MHQDVDVGKTKRHAYTQESTHAIFESWFVCVCSLWVCVCMSVRDIHGCDSVRGAQWFPKQAVSLTEGLFVKENTGKNLSMSKVC